MDFVRALDDVDAFLRGGGFRLAVIGGVALAAYGHTRMTLDLDIVTDAGAQDTLVAFMESRGFVTLHRSSATRTTATRIEHTGEWTSVNRST